MRVFESNVELPQSVGPIRVLFYAKGEFSQLKKPPIIRGCSSIGVHWRYTGIGELTELYNGAIWLYQGTLHIPKAPNVEVFTFVKKQAVAIYQHTKEFVTHYAKTFHGFPADTQELKDFFRLVIVRVTATEGKRSEFSISCRTFDCDEKEKSLAMLMTGEEKLFEYLQNGNWPSIWRRATKVPS